MAKHYLSLCCIVKNEKNIEEFIIYYSILGVQHFYIYDNDSFFPIRQRLNKFFYKNICTIIDFPGSCQQINAYNHCIQNYGVYTTWMILVDADEYILIKEERYLYLRDFLYLYDNFYAIGINWVIFGTSYYDRKQNGYLIDKYRYCSNEQNPHIKTIFKPEFVINITNPHYVNIINPSKYIDPKKNIISGFFNEHYTIDIIQINHYWSKSVEDMIEKYNRGNADSLHRIHILNEPHSVNNNIVDNTLPNKYLDQIKKIYRSVNAHWEIYKALHPDLAQFLFTEEDYYLHLYNHGIYENRFFSIYDKYPSFSPSIYRSNYDDLKNMSTFELEKHYITYGIHEHRMADKKINF